MTSQAAKLISPSCLNKGFTYQLTYSSASNMLGEIGLMLNNTHARVNMTPQIREIFLSTTCCRIMKRYEEPQAGAFMLAQLSWTRIRSFFSLQNIKQEATDGDL